LSIRTIHVKFLGDLLKLLLIAPARLGRRARKGKQVHQLNLAVLAGLATPYFDEIKIVEEDFIDLDLNESADLVGITMLTSQAVRGYELGDHFRKRGIPTICGGPHPSYMVEESLEHFDSVVIREAENTWHELMADFQQGKLKTRYQSDIPVDLSQLPMPRKDLFQGPKSTLNAQVLQTGRGCPFGCNFCTVTATYGRHFRTRPVEHVIEEIKRFPSKIFFFVDDNIFFDSKYAYELFEALIPLKIRWGSQGSLNRIAGDDQLLALAARSGCMSLFVGIESIEQKTLDASHKSFNRVSRYKEDIQKVHRAGISLIAAFIFGFEEDTPATFQKVRDFAIANSIMLVNTGILTPFPGTKLFDEYEERGLINDYDWSKYDGGKLVWNHPNFTKEQIEWEKNQLSSQFYSLRSITKRVWANWHNPLYYSVMNLINWRKSRVHRGISMPQNYCKPVTAAEAF
jgi:radical SAM superfamily enzyme YgiQ (UPF0313 family)